LRLPRLSIRAKLLGLTVAMLLGAIITYVVLAIRMFESDKTAYIYDGNATLVGALAAEVEASLDGMVKTLTAAASLARQSAAFTSPAAQLAAVELIFRQEADLVDAVVYPVGSDLKTGAPLAKFANPETLAAAGVDATFLATLHRLQPFPTAAAMAEGVHVESATVDGGPPLLMVGVSVPSTAGATLAVATMRLDRVLQIFAKSELYDTFLLDAGGRLLAHGGTNLDPEVLAARQKQLVTEVLAAAVRTGVKELSGATGTVIAAYSKLAVAGLTVVAEIDRDQAFLASRQLVRKSVLFAAAILLAALMISTLASRQITTPIKRLYLATRQVSQGDFNVKVVASSRDEVGELAQSFNRMTREILRLLGQVREKARMEKELETAKLVQETLFPEPSYRHGGVELASYYTPASECGGDWCGYFQIGGRLLVLIGDATGHGVPAALITAAAQSCATTLVDSLRGRPEQRPSAGAFVGALNRAIHGAARGRVKMTFFASVIDPAARSMTYVNASHELPIVVHGPGAATKRTLLSGAPDPCLGEDPATVYKEHQVTLAPGDAVVWYTDGLLECRDAQAEEWGEWRFVKSLERHAAASAVGLKDAIVAEALKFSEAGDRDDDITLVIAKLAAAS
jgi:sigma-B regulation protein RsbU (phosphoserine phosphatase)